MRKKLHSLYVFFDLSVALFLLCSVCFFAFCLPDQVFEESYSPALYDKDGNLLSARVAEDEQWRFFSSDTIPQKYKDCLVLFEDKRFFDHPGVDLVAIGRAIKQNLKAGKIVSGGSTLSMQTVRLSRKNPKRSYAEKLLEFYRALRLETLFSKEEILTMYANHAPMGANVVGLEGASWKYFGHSPSQLSWAEAATLAVLPNSPGKMYPGKNEDLLKAKRNRLLYRLFEEGFLDKEDLSLASTEPIPVEMYGSERLADLMLNKHGLHHKSQIESTIDAQLQRQCEYYLAQQIKRWKPNEVHHGAVIVAEVATGEVKAYVANDPDGQSDGSAIDLIQVPRSSGSILKPFLYADMLEHGELLPDMLVEDIPTRIYGYRPENYNKLFSGAISASDALARSLNVPAVLALQKHGVNPTLSMFNSLGFSNLDRSGSSYGLSLILGGGEVSLWQVANAYLGLTRQTSKYSERQSTNDLSDYKSLHYAKEFTQEAAPEEPPFGAGAAFLTLSALKKVNRPSGEAGWERFTDQRGISWKTGTSFGGRDAWAAGTNGRYVVAVWMGNANGQGCPALTGTATSAPLMFQIFRNLDGAALPIPYDDLAEVTVCSQSGHRANRSCPETHNSYILDRPTIITACPYHVKATVTANGKFRVAKNCYDGAIEQRTYFQLNPMVSAYYKKSHPSFADLPPFYASCAEGEANALEIVYPLANMEISLPRQLNGKMGTLVAKASAAGANQIFYWHLDDEYIGSTEEIHQMELSLDPGEYTLGVYNQSGFFKSVVFKVN